MKKIYSTPTTNVNIVECVRIIANSINNEIGNGVQLSRESNDWEDWEEDM